jgi:beta-lactamase class A
MAVGISLVLQILYPHSWALPQTSIGGKSFAFKSEQQIASSIATLQSQKMQISSGSQVLKYTPTEIGVILAGKQDARQAVNYGWRERLVPFSFFFERRNIPYFSFTVDEAKVSKFAATLQKFNKQPVNAVVRLEGANVVIDKHQDGYIYDAAGLAQHIKHLELTSNMKATLQPTVVPPSITDQAASEAAGVLQQRLQQPITVKAQGKSVVADKTLLASWIVVTPDAQNKKLQVTYDKEKVKQWLADLANQVYRPGAPRAVTMVDGVVVSESNASDGIALNVAATADAFVAAAGAKQTSVEGVTVPVTVASQVARNYTRSSKGLQALLDYWDANNGGTWGIVLKTTDGSISANLNPNRQFISASVYKIYVAYVVYTKTDNGELSMSAQTGNGYTVAGCLDLMIVRSDNACANELGNMIGWDANDGMLHAKGFGLTTIAQGGKLTTAQDAANYLLQLQGGTLLSNGNKDDLLYKMGHNIYRYAIPAGSPGMHSANKLGAAGAYNHDVAIVYHPKGTYVLSVFSQGSNHASIRELARQVTNVMNQ